MSATALHAQPVVSANPRVPISWGELIDKITILEIKAERLTSATALANVRRELTEFAAAAGRVRSAGPELAALKASLKGVNEALWEIEDRIRAEEVKGEFGATFIALARAVYHKNDERGRIKRAINTLLHSDLVEEKQYHAY